MVLIEDGSSSDDEPRAAAAVKPKMDDNSDVPRVSKDEIMQMMRAAGLGEEAMRDAASPPSDESTNVVMADGRIDVTGDGGVIKRVVAAPFDAASPTVPVMNRVYVLMHARVSDADGGALFIDSDVVGEVGFILGRAEQAKGVEMAVCAMRCGERAELTMTAKYGYSRTRRPADVPEAATLVIDVTVVRFEKENNLHQMSVDDKFAFVEQRRVIGRALFAGPPATATSATTAPPPPATMASAHPHAAAAESAFLQYKKAHTVVSSACCSQVLFCSSFLQSHFHLALRSPNLLLTSLRLYGTLSSIETSHTVHAHFIRALVTVGHFLSLRRRGHHVRRRRGWHVRRRR
jgi:hypothetical protein